MIVLSHDNYVIASIVYPLPWRRMHSDFTDKGWYTLYKKKATCCILNTVFTWLNITTLIIIARKTNVQTIPVQFEDNIYNHNPL